MYMTFPNSLTIPTPGNMDGPREHYTEQNKSDREGEISYDIPYMWNLKRNDTNELTYKAEIQIIENV